MVKSALVGEDGGCLPTPLSLYLLSVEILCSTLQLRGQIHSPSFFSALYVGRHTWFEDEMMKCDELGGGGGGGGFFKVLGWFGGFGGDN
jgi:hypothetical protein